MKFKRHTHKRQINPRRKGLCLHLFRCPSTPLRGIVQSVCSYNCRNISPDFLQSIRCLLKTREAKVENDFKITGNEGTSGGVSIRFECWPNCLRVNMSPRLKVFDRVIQRLENLEEHASGFLLGTSDDSCIYVLGLVRQLDSTPERNDPNYLSNYDITPNLPANINFSGVFKVFSGEEPDINNGDLCKTIGGTPVVISCNSASKKLTCYIYKDGEARKIEHTLITANDLEKSFICLRLTATIPLSCDSQSESVTEAFKYIQQKIADGNAAFRVSGSDVYILGDKASDVSGSFSDSTLEKFYSAVKNSEKSESGINVLDVSLYLKGTNNDMSPQLAPLIKYVKKKYKHVGIQLAVDSLCYASNQLKVKQLYHILVEGINRNLDLNEKNLLSQLKSSEIRDVSLPKTYHFFPSDCGHFLSIVYPAKHTPEQLKKCRENFHALLSLPMNKPLFRQANAFDFSMESKDGSGKMILNPHEGLPKSGVPDGEPCLVRGTYAYHHYMQDNFDDNGWGCAYRSLQTIFSWFRFQGYTNSPVPTHKEIQQCLVNIGDKPGSFVGSKQWIGSTEVSFVLDTMLGVTCRIVSVSSGEEMTMKGGELSYHFKTQGTPVMIGGGVLAHTILGVDYNKKTGAIKFLILDPHYTGSEDLKIIQSKGWCGWKGPEFWKKDAFYNMCLPLTPKCV